ncbi:TyrR/PhhR family helix-turn-helix DNA-binding protein [Microbulbifer celer]|uniref:HTH-type transcriptional regulatory protein TyrR n=1 Tax=Microbulbifer celer TaxID=435905 RepID=A0ABW3U7K4_9GAMM|nr:TyrR/PhhR family helix-turn-helix DNA-binding protein [Microbulbifer celer]UFN58686.1 hypothetical protein LPW13_06500 [Microbulbifer celer]
MRVEITCSNRVGILQEIMAIFGEYRVNITSGELGGDDGDKVYLAAPGLLMTQYQTIERALSRVPGLRRVRRIELMPSERRHFELDTLLQHVVDEPVLSVDPEGRIIAANLAAAKACGVSQGQLAGMQLQRFVPRLQLDALLEGYTVPRYGLPVTLRGKTYRLDWSPIALRENPAGPESLAGAVLTLAPVEASYFEPGVQGGSANFVSDSSPPVLWDSGRRREACLRLQQLAPLSEPLLIIGERGAGKTTFAAAAHHLSPLADRCGARWLACDRVAELSKCADDVVIIDDLDLWSPEGQIQLVSAMRQKSAGRRLIATVASVDKLAPALLQFLSTLTLRLPPLRTMRPVLGAFASRILAMQGETVMLDEGAQGALMLSDWPNNFCGLTAVLLAGSEHARKRGSGTLVREDLPGLMTETRLPWHAWGEGLGYREMMEKIERALLEEFTRTQPSTRELARRLGISHTAVANKLRKYGLNVKHPS